MKVFSLLYIYFLLTVPAHAYLDPGMGSIIVAAIAASFAAVATTFKFWWHKLKAFINKFFSKKKINNSNSESPDN